MTDENEFNSDDDLPPDDSFQPPDEQSPFDDASRDQPVDAAGDGPQSQEIRHSQVSALVPEHVARGVFSTGAVVLQGAHEFIVDFLLRMQQPQQVAARIVLPPSVVPQLIQALKENLTKYESRFGKPLVPGAALQQQQAQQKQQGQGQPGQPQPQAQKASAQDLYEQLKLPEDVMSGDYANAVMIGHTATEFSFDFITTFFPRSSVAKRVYLSAPNAPRLLESLEHSFKQFQQRRVNPPQQPGQQPPPPDGFGTSQFDANP